MNVEQLAAAVRAVVAQMPPAALVEAATRLDEAHQALATAVAGSTQAETGQAVAQLSDAARTLTEVHEVIQRARALVEDYLARIGGGPQPTPAAISGNRDGGARAPDPARRKPERPSPPPQVQAVLDGLPPKVPKPNPEGRKTHGKILGDPTGEVVISGDDAESAEVKELLAQAGLNPRGTLVTIHHVEMKVAKRMTKTGTRDVTLVINNRACEGFMGCRALLPVILPAGYTLTVYGPGYHEVFRGGKKWPS